MHVYIADDEPGIRTMIRKLADREGLSSTECCNGSQLLSAMASHSGPGLIFLDLQMPEKDGIEVLQTLGQFTARLPIFLMTGGSAVNADIAQSFASALGLNTIETLRKPVPLKVLGEILRKYAKAGAY